MTTDEFKEACEALGAKNATRAAEMLGLTRSMGWRIWNGQRNVSPRTEARLERARKALPRALSPRERRVLDRAKKVGDHVLRPGPRSNYEMGMDWAGVFSRLTKDRLLERREVRQGVRPPSIEYRVTRKGLRAINFYREIENA